MSQEKVDRYKAEKANRKKILKKQKRMNYVRKATLGVVTLALLGWLGYSAVITYEENQERPVAEVNYDSVVEYLNEIAQ
jgi:homogentisate 1,2-dioxygenase